MCSEISAEEPEKSRNGKGFKGPENYGQEAIRKSTWQFADVGRPLEGFVRKSTWQVADVRRPLVSASHIIQARNDLFIGKSEAYIMNRKRMGKSVLRKEGRKRTHISTLQIMVQVLCEFAVQEIRCSSFFGRGAPCVDGVWVLQ